MTTVGASSDGDGLAYRDVDDLGSVGLSSGKRSCLYNYLSCLLWPSPSSTKGKSWWMRFLLEEHWTDGSLIALKVDIFSGLTLAVAQVAPSIAFALMGHGPPLTGLFSSFFLGMICCLFGGRPGQITAIAGAVVVLYPNLVDKHGYGAVCAVSVIAGAMIVLPGVFRIARLVRLLPSALMVGFCNGLALSMVKNEIHSFKDAQGHYIQGKQALNTSIICIVSFAIMMLMPYFTKMVPAAFTAIVVGTAMEYIFHMNTITIGELYELHGDFPRPQVPDMDWSNSDAMKEVMLYSFLTAVISCIESFMSGYKIQQLTETPTNFERESIALGVAHIVNGFFQGMPGCVVFGPCILNLECGSGTRRLSSFICALLMVIIPVALYFVIGIIPMGALSAVVFGVSSKTADWRMLAMILLRRISLQESVVALVVTVVTVFTDLAVGAAAGFTAALLFFMWNMARGRVSMRPMENTAPFAMHPALPPAPPASRILSATNLDDDDEYPLRKRIILFEDSTSSTLTGDAPRRRRGAAGREDEGAAETATTTTASTTTHLRHVDIATAPITPMRSFAGPAITGVGAPAHTMEVNFLHIDVDPVFPDIKVLRVKLRGVLFFGSCVEFVDGMMDMLHTHHGEMFMKVTDLILDFQLGMMPVMDFSAAEAIQDAAKILLKRGIRTHTQNMDPMSWACFERCRRYFEDVVEDNVNNTKHVCYVRRMLNHFAHRKVCGGFGAESPSTSAGLDDDVFLRATNFLAEDGGGVEPTMDDATERVFTSTEVQLTFVETVKVGFPIYREAFGITVPVFDTVDGWVKRVEAATLTAQGNPLCWGLTPDPPFHRKFGDIGRLWFRRIPQLDVPAEGGPSIPHGTPPSFREPPTCFEQRPRFPGQGYAKAERLTRREWRSIKAYVCKRLFHSPPPPELGIVAARMQRFGKEVADGFV